MNRCVFYIEGSHPAVIPPGQEYDGLRYTVCGHDAPYMVNGSSYCPAHVKNALGRTAIKVGKRAPGRCAVCQRLAGMPTAPCGSCPDNPPGEPA